MIGNEEESKIHSFRCSHLDAELVLSLFVPGTEQGGRGRQRDRSKNTPGLRVTNLSCWKVSKLCFKYQETCAGHSNPWEGASQSAGHTVSNDSANRVLLPSSLLKFEFSSKQGENLILKQKFLKPKHWAFLPWEVLQETLGNMECNRTQKLRVEGWRWDTTTAKRHQRFGKWLLCEPS